MDIPVDAFLILHAVYPDITCRFIVEISFADDIPGCIQVLLPVSVYTKPQPVSLFKMGLILKTRIEVNIPISGFRLKIPTCIGDGVVKNGAPGTVILFAEKITSIDTKTDI